MARIALVLLTVIFFTTTSQTYAQEATPSADTPSNTSPTLDSSRQQLLERRNAARERLDEDSIQLREEANSRRQVFRQRLAQIQDETRQRIVERIDNRLQLVNENLTNSFENVLANLEKVLEQIEVRRDSLASQGKDVSSLTGAISDARSTIESTKALVNTQSEKAYIIDISSDASLRVDAQETINTFKTDIRTLRDELLNAKDSVVASARLAASLSGN